MKHSKSGMTVGQYERREEEKTDAEYAISHGVFL
jgi:hypothetical protein